MKGVIARLKKFLFPNRGPQLMLAIKNFDEKNVSRLLNSNQQLINYQDQDGNTPLHLAYSESLGYTERSIPKLIQNFNPNTNITNKYGLKADDIVKGYELAEAIDKNDFVKVQKLINDNNKLIGFRDMNGNTPLHIASDKLNYKIVLFLLEKGADINAKNSENLTPLHNAALFRVSAEIPEDASKTQTAIIDQYKEKLAQSRDEGLKTIKLLIDRGADVTAVTFQGDTALHIAARSPYPTKNIAELLINKGADINAQNMNKKTALDIAVDLAEDYKPNELIDLLDNAQNIKKKPAAVDLAEDNKPNELIDLLDNEMQKSRTDEILKRRTESEVKSSEYKIHTPNEDKPITLSSKSKTTIPDLGLYRNISKLYSIFISNVKQVNSISPINTPNSINKVNKKISKKQQ